jgi:hypothetical protein
VISIATEELMKGVLLELKFAGSGEGRQREEMVKACSGYVKWCRLI